MAQAAPIYSGTYVVCFVSFFFLCFYFQSGEQKEAGLTQLGKRSEAHLVLIST